MRLTLSIAACIACIAASAKAHEFWIDPVDFTVAVGETVTADLRVGTEFEGSSQPYIPRSFKRFQYVQDGVVKQVPGTVGDRPALSLKAEKEGLMVVIHQTSDLAVTWSTWDKFKNFVEHKDAGWVLDEHIAKGWPQEDVREVYSRYAKSLVSVGAGAGKDGIAGMEIELVALENPYTGQMGDGMRVGLLYRGKPLPVTQVEVFEMSQGGAVRIFTVMTDSKGVANVPVKAGKRYMLDAVVLRTTNKERGGKPFLWESVWANLTFGTPG